MIEIKTEWTEENLKRYMMYKFFFSNKFTMLSTVVFGLCFAVISVSCAVMFAMTESAVFLVLVGAVVVLAGGAAAFFVLKINKNVKASVNENSALSERESVILDEDKITVCKNETRFGEIGWEKIVSIELYDKGKTAYLATEEGAVLILEYKNIVTGTEKDLREMLLIKNVKLSEKA